MRTFIRLMFFILAFISIAAVSFGDPMTDAKNAAAGLSNTVSAAYGSKAGIKQNISNPLISNTPMYTLDRSQSFNVQMSCPSSSAFLQVFVQPASSGDLRTVLVSEDLDMDGKPDYTYQLPVPVSGVCANGFISCDPGTWNNCSYYQWTADSTGKVRAASALITNLGGCYCINSSCGSDLVWNNLGIVLKDLGGGVAGAIQGTDPQLAVSNVSTDGPTISYYGQKAGSCASAGGGTGTSNPEQYYSNPYSMQGAAQNLAQSESTDPSSYYSELQTAQDMSSGNVQLQRCSISTILQCSATNPGYTENVDDGCQGLETDPDCRLKDETVDGVQTWLDFASTGLQPLAPACDSITVQYIAPCSGFTGSDNWGGSHYLQFAGEGNQIAINHITDTCMCVTSTQYINLPAGVTASGSTGYIDWYQDGRAQTVTISGTGSGISFYGSKDGYDGAITLTDAPASGSISFNTYNCFSYSFSGLGDQIAISACGTSGSLTFESNCPLGGQYACLYRSEANVISGASVNGTNYVCPIDTSNGGSEICYMPPTTDTVCPDFLEKDRTYYCNTNAPFDFSDVQKRMGNIASTATDNTTSIYYQDLTKDSSGNWTATDYNEGLPSKDIAADCEQACKTEKTNTDTQAAISGNASQYQSNNTQSLSFYYKTCVNGTCPVGPGETIVEDCQCIDDFGEAAGIMQSMRMAGQDMICSDGTAEPLQ